MLPIPLAALLCLAAPTQAPEGAAKAAAVAPVLGEEVSAVAYIDVARLDVQASLRRLLGKFGDEADVAGVSRVVAGWVGALKQAGAKDLFVLFDLTDMPAMPVVAVPLAPGVDGKAIGEVLCGGVGGPVRWPACATVRGVVVAGPPGALARIREGRPAARPELAAALKAAGDAPIGLALIPSTTQRRVLEETVPALPTQLGGGPITDVTQGLSWAALALAFEPRPAPRAVLQAKDAGSAQALAKLVQAALDLAAAGGPDKPGAAELAEAIGRVRPEVQGDRVTLEVDLEKAAALVAVPLRRARATALRTQCVNNLKQIALAMHNYHSARNSFPPAYSADKDGKPLLSWRVHILPFMEQKTLYDEFHLDEPWDSPHNRALIARMPRVYACPAAPGALAAGGKTTYLTPRGPATIFPGAQGIKIQEILDGTSNTALVVDAADAAAVPWTKPSDWDAAPEIDPRVLFGHHPEGTNVAFADGSVRFLKDTIAPKVLEALVTRSGGEVVNENDY